MSTIRSGERYYLNDEDLAKLLERWDNPYYGEEEIDKEVVFVDGNKHEVLLGTYVNGTARNFEFQ